MKLEISSLLIAEVRYLVVKNIFLISAATGSVVFNSSNNANLAAKF